MRLGAAVALAGLALGLAGAGQAATTPTAPVYDDQGRLVDTPFAPAAGGPRLTQQRAIALFLADSKVADWLDRYPPKPATAADFKSAVGNWTVKVWSGEAGQIGRASCRERVSSVV